MMFSALFSFLGGATLRMVLGHLSEWFTAKTEHNFELDRLRIQSELDQANHTRMIEMLKVQAEMGLKIIEAKRESNLAGLEAEGFNAAIAATSAKAGIYIIDLWNGVIRPFLATVSIFVWVIHLYHVNWVPSPWDLDLMSSALGIFVGGRIKSTGR
jgi:hypothetical protein